MRTGSAALVSVMIPVFNCARYLGEAIESVRDQAYRPIELIVVDDGSDDGSGDVARRYAPFVRYVYQPRAGIGAARNYALGLARGSLFSFFDADDRFTPGRLERQVETLDVEPELDAVFGHLREFVSPDLDEPHKALLRRPIERAPCYIEAAMVIRRDAFYKVGLFSTTLRVGTGIEWYTRLAERGLKTAMLPHIVLERRLHAQNTSIREHDAITQYCEVLKASLDRRRAAGFRPSARPDGLTR